MKWPIVGLFVLGVIAAGSAAVLVTVYQGRSQDKTATTRGPETESEVPLLVAATDIPARSVVEADDILVRSMPRAGVPEDSFRDPSQVVGKVLVVPLRASQPFTRASFALEGSGVSLTSVLDPGMRAVSIHLSDPMGLENLLYPGSVVDVLVTLDMKEEEAGERAISFTLLEAVMVLALGNQSVASPAPAKETGTGVQSSGRPSVTLLVTPQQAEILKLAMQEGSISLSLRNPMDTTPANIQAVDLSALSPIISAAGERARQRGIAREKERAERAAEEKEKRDYEMQKARWAFELSRNEVEIARMKNEREKIEEQNKLTTVEQKEAHPVWETVVLRGGAATVQTFEIPAKK